MNTRIKTIYISGPMTGMPNHNFEWFHDAEEQFTRHGWKVINPANNFGGRSDLPREDYMRTDFVAIAKADAIAMLPGWQKSRGATAEYLVAIECGLEIYDALTLIPMENPPAPSVLIDKETQNTAIAKTTGTSLSLPDSGSRQQFESGAVRDEATDKPRLELISPFAEVRLGHHLRRGAEKYTPRNWEAGIPFDRCIASLKRHIAAYQMRDESEDHLAAILANAMFLAHYEAMISVGILPRSLDDRPVYLPATSEKNEVACA
ncbi:MAG: DUF4406 domain-containing protein [Planctomycetia bacterium]|jgi:hypothetical protein